MEKKITTSVEELTKMMVHKCDYCDYAPAQCSEQNGCENGISRYLSAYIGVDEDDDEQPELFSDEILPNSDIGFDCDDEGTDEGVSEDEMPSEWDNDLFED